MSTLFECLEIVFEIPCCITVMYRFNIFLVNFKFKGCVSCNGALKLDYIFCGSLFHVN